MTEYLSLTFKELNLFLPSKVYKVSLEANQMLYFPTVSFSSFLVTEFQKTLASVL